MITVETVLRKISSYSFEDDKNGLLAEVIKSSANDYAKGSITREEYEEILSDIDTEIKASNMSANERKLQNLYFAARVLLKVV